jgi:hypothetical protein
MLYSDCFRGVYGYIAAHVHDPPTAEDLTSETFLRAWRRWPPRPGPGCSRSRGTYAERGATHSGSFGLHAKLLPMHTERSTGTGHQREHWLDSIKRQAASGDNG